MYRGTTPTLSFELPFDVSEATSLYITISQRYDNIQIEKSLEDCSVDGTIATVSLTQEETLRLVPDKPVFIQVRVVKDGVAMASDMIKTTVKDVLKDGVI